jgi:hypothetical protein
MSDFGALDLIASSTTATLPPIVASSVDGRILKFYGKGGAGPSSPFNLGFTVNGITYTFPYNAVGGDFLFEATALWRVDNNDLMLQIVSPMSPAQTLTSNGASAGSPGVEHVRIEFGGSPQTILNFSLAGIDPAGTGIGFKLYVL